MHNERKQGVTEQHFTRAVAALILCTWFSISLCNERDFRPCINCLFLLFPSLPILSHGVSFTPSHSAVQQTLNCTALVKMRCSLLAIAIAFLSLTATITLLETPACTLTLVLVGNDYPQKICQWSTFVACCLIIDAIRLTFVH